MEKGEGREERTLPMPSFAWRILLNLRCLSIILEK